MTDLLTPTERACFVAVDRLFPGSDLVSIAEDVARRAARAERRRLRLKAEAWIRHGQSVPADVTTYDRRIVHSELLAMFVDAEQEAAR